jgi:two-component system chemotaxis sensor kinase CheA
MDVVKTNIKAIQGNVEIETLLGKGTCFRIFLPLTLAIIDSVVVRMGDEKFVVPLTQVTEFFRPLETDINLVYGKKEILTLREEPLAAHRLSVLLERGTDSKTKSAWDLTALIVRDGSGKSAAILVDQIVAQQQVVIKPLGSELTGKLGLMGSAILGDGKPALILDLFEILKSTGGTKRTNSKTNEMKMEAA